MKVKIEKFEVLCNPILNSFIQYLFPQVAQAKLAYVIQSPVNLHTL